jgi:hypothetical protein
MSEPTRIARRTLFAGIGVAAAAVVATKLMPKTTVADSAVPPPADPGGDGYRLTDHIKKYYRTTTI